MPQSAFGDLVVLLPGILGSKLARRGVTVWDLSIRHLPRLLWEAFNGGLVLEGDGVDPPDDGIEAVDLFHYQLLPGFFGVDDYQSIADALRRIAGAEQVIPFPYDWRLSNRHAAKRLETTAMDALARWRQKSGNAGAKLWLVCHSMGGLVARYFCEHLGGAAHTRAVVTIGTPHRGSVKALEGLVNGVKYGPINLTPLIRSLPSAYELLPLFPVMREAGGMHRIAELFGLDPVTGARTSGPQSPDVSSGDRRSADQRSADGGPEVRAPLPGIDRAMLQRALQFHRDIRVPAMARAESPYLQYAFFNRRQRTPLSAQMNGGTLEALMTYGDEDSRGDGTVPSFASVPIEWADTREAIAVGEKHTAMQAVDTVQDTIFNWMRPLDVRARRGASTLDSFAIALDVPASLTAGEELVVSVSALAPTNASVEVTNVETNAVVRRPVMLPGEDAVVTAVFPKIVAAGTYRVTARHVDPMKPAVSDYVFVTR